MLHMYYIYIYIGYYTQPGGSIWPQFTTFALSFQYKRKLKFKKMLKEILKNSCHHFPFMLLPKMKACMPYCEFLSSLWQIPAEQQLHAMLFLFSWQIPAEQWILLLYEKFLPYDKFLLWNKSLTSISFMSCVLFLPFINSCRMTNSY